MHLLTKRTFAPLFWTQFLGAFNDNLLKHTLAMWVFNEQLTVFGVGHAQMVLLITAIFIAPYFLFSATAGQLTDKLDKSFMVRATKNLEIVAMAVGAYGFWVGNAELVTGVLFAMGIQSTLFGPAKYGILPQHLPEEDLVEGNALVETATQLAILGGTITGGLCYAYRSEVAVALVLLAVLGRVTAQLVPSAPSSQPDLVVQWDPFRPTWNLVRSARQNRPIWLSILGISWFWMFGAAVLPLLQVYTEQVIHGNDHVQTLFLTLFSVGVGVGSMWAGRLSHERVELGIVPIGSLGMTLFTADLWWMGTPWPDRGALIGPVEFLSTFAGVRIAIDLTLLAVAGGIMTVPLYALVQQRAKKEEKARVIAVNNIVNSFWMVVGAGVLVGLQAAGLTTSQTFLLLGLVTFGVSAYMYWVVREFALRFVTWILANVAYRVTVLHPEKIPKTGPCLITPNHVSFIDWFVLLGALHEPPRVVMDRDIHKWPVLGFLFRQANTIPITSAKVDPKCLEEAMESISAALREGWSVVIFPEGRLTGDGAMGEFRPGMERILARDPVPVIPVAINGLWGSFFSRKEGKAMAKPFRRGTFSPVWLTFGDPIPAAQATAKATEDRVRAMWSAMPDAP
jgi:1-acyl-sn-glycerol-3-phosphate acyltransferase